MIPASAKYTGTIDKYSLQRLEYRDVFLARHREDPPKAAPTGLLLPLSFAGRCKMRCEAEFVQKSAHPSPRLSARSAHTIRLPVTNTDPPAYRELAKGIRSPVVSRGVMLRF